MLGGLLGAGEVDLFVPFPWPSDKSKTWRLTRAPNRERSCFARVRASYFDRRLPGLIAGPDPPSLLASLRKPPLQVEGWSRIRAVRSSKKRARVRARGFVPPLLVAAETLPSLAARAKDAQARLAGLGLARWTTVAVSHVGSIHRCLSNRPRPMRGGMRTGRELCGEHDERRQGSNPKPLARPS